MNAFVRSKTLQIWITIVNEKVCMFVLPFYGNVGDECNTGKSHFINFVNVINSYIICHGKTYQFFLQIHLLNIRLVDSKYHIRMMILLHPLNGIVHETCNINLVR